MQDEGPVRWVAVSTAYREVAFTRRVARVGGPGAAPGVFVVEDRMDGAGVAHAYSLLLNGFAGGDVPASSFELLPGGAGARWVNASGRVDAIVVPADPAGPGVSHDLQEHQHGWGAWAMHERLRVDSTMTDPAGFLTVLVPGAAADAPPAAVEIARPAAGVAAAAFTLGDVPWVVAINHTGAAAQVAIGGGTLEVAPGLLVRAGDDSTTLAAP